MEKKKQTKSWAESEIELFKSVNKDKYYKMCADAALTAYKVLEEQGHSGSSWKITSEMLNRLCHGLPLVPIDDIPKNWIEISTDEVGKHYQSTRIATLFKDVHFDGTVHYHDLDRIQYKYAESPNSLWTARVQKIEDMYPISFPYYPSEHPYIVFAETAMSKDCKGDYDVEWFYNITYPDGSVAQLGFGCVWNDNNEWREIDYETFCKVKRGEL